MSKYSECYRPIDLRIQREIEAAKKSGPFTIGVNGIDASGKTTFALHLSEHLTGRGYDVQIVHVDDFHNEKSVRYSGEDPAYNFYYKSINLARLAADILEPIIRKGELDVELTLLDLRSDKFILRKQYRVHRDSIVIVEGIFLFKRELRNYFDYKVFLDISFDEAIRRALIRDTHLPFDEIEQRYKSKYQAGQRIYFALENPIRCADLVIDNNNPHAPVATVQEKG